MSNKENNPVYNFLAGLVYTMFYTGLVVAFGLMLLYAFLR